MNEDLVRKTIRRIFGQMLLKEFESTDDSLDEISVEEVHIPKEYIHDRLNPQIWIGDELRTDVRKHMLKTAKEFYKFLEISAPIQSIKFLGSMANYNWSSQSDLDIHLFFDFNTINEDVELVKNYLDAKKTEWNSNHDINIKGFTVEMYSQDLTEENASIGVFDLLKNEWEQKPTLEDFKIDKQAIVKKIISIVNQIEKLENQSDLTTDEVYKCGTTLKEKIKKMRRSGLETGGEFSTENLAFKYLRNNGYLEKLSDMTINAFDYTLSLS